MTNRKSHIYAFIATLLAGLACFQTCLATNGYFAHGYGIKSTAMAGTGVAFHQDAMAAAVNPAGMAFVGKNITGGVTIFSPPRRYEAFESQNNGEGGAFTLATGKEKSDNDIFPIPTFGINYPLNEKNTLGLTLYGNGGINSSFSGGAAIFDPDGSGSQPVGRFDGVLGDGTAGLHLVQAFANLSFTHKLNDKIAIGISPIVAVQTLRANGLSRLSGFTETSARSVSTTGSPRKAPNLTSNGDNYSYGGGIQIGFQANDILPKLDIGASFRSRIYMTRFKEYEDLFAENGDFDIPETLWAGLAFHPTENISLVFDFQRIWFSNIDTLGNDFQNLSDCPSLGGTDFESCFGGSSGPGAGWDNINVYKFGAQWQALPRLTLRAGYSHTNQPVNNDQLIFGILAPGIAEDHITAGLTYSASPRFGIDMIVHYSPSNTVSGVNPLDTSQRLEAKLEEFEVGIGFSYRY